MAGYQRFVAYVYEYRKGKKDGSSGYVRVEAMDRKCRMEVHLRCVGLEPGSRCRVYGFVRREGLMDGILIGSCVTGQERIECILETDAGDIGGMGKSLQDLGGMLLISDAGGFWGTEWDDQPIRPENFREWKKEKSESQKEAERNRKEREKNKETEEGEMEQSGASSELSENEEAKIMKAEEVLEEDIGFSAGLIQQSMEFQQESTGAAETGLPKSPEPPRRDQVNPGSDPRPPESLDPGHSRPEPGPSPSELPRPGQGNPGSGPHPPEPPRPGQQRPNPGPHPPEPPRPGQPRPNPGPRPPEPPRPGQPRPNPGPRPPEPSRPPRPLPGIPCDGPFNDGQFTDCRKIKPSDCSVLCKQNGCFCNNRFVIYGYQNFGHLLLCRNHRGQYILGVPGGYSQQERFMANMFGFPYFKECQDIHIPGGKGGYWYCFINV